MRPASGRGACPSGRRSWLEEDVQPQVVPPQSAEAGGQGTVVRPGLAPQRGCGPTVIAARSGHLGSGRSCILMHAGPADVMLK
jgi:hypothetical protein